MSQLLGNYKLIFPELLMVALIALNFVLTFFSRINKKFIYLINQLGLLSILYRICLNFEVINKYFIKEQHDFFIKGLFLNFENNCLKLFVVILLFILFVYVKDYLHKKYDAYSEYFIFSLLSLLGGMILISSNSFVYFYIGIEMCVIPIYYLITLGNNKNNLENSLNFFVINSVFSGLLLYGLSLIYGAAGNLEFIKIIYFIQNQHISIAFNIGIILVLVSILFKLYMIPLQIWVAEIHKDCPIIAIPLLSVFINIALIGSYNHLIKNILMDYLNFKQQIPFIMLSIFAMLTGNIGMIIQDNIKKMFGYAFIGHSGFMLLGLFSKHLSGIVPGNLYAVIYGIIMINMWGAIIILRNQGIHLERISDFAGLAKKNPLISCGLLILLLAMSGLAPTIGFYSKILILQSLINADLIWVAIIAGLISLLSLYCYFKIIKFIYFHNKLNKNINYLGCINKANYPAIILLLFNCIWILFAWILFPLSKI